MTEAREREVVYYETGSEVCPFKKWFDRIRDKRALQAVDARIARLRAGNLGVSRSVGEGVMESKVDLGPGYRIYFGIDGDVIVLLRGGDKSTQDADIALAKSFWSDYKKRR
jgi:putative addiction module killer protein